MEHENHYSSNGKGNLGVTLGAIGTGLGVLSGGLGGLGILNGGCNNNCANNGYVNRYEASQSARIAELETEVKLRDANIYTDAKSLELYRYIDGKIAGIEGQICQQNVYNATNTATINCLSGQIATLMSLTKTVVPISSVCPTPMPEYNSWTAPTTTA